MNPLTPSQRTLVAEHLHIPRIYAAKAVRRNADLRSYRDDIYQQGCLGLMMAAVRFDSTRGVKFASYATPWVAVYARRASEGVGQIAEYLDVQTSAPRAETVAMANDVIENLLERRRAPRGGNFAKHPDRDVEMYLRVVVFGDEQQTVADVYGISRATVQQQCRKVERLVRELRKAA